MENDTPILLGSSQANKGPSAMPVPPMPSSQKPAPPKKDGGKKKGWLWPVILILVVAAATYMFVNRDMAPEAVREVPEGEGLPMQARVVTGDSAKPSFIWEFNPAGGDSQTGAPHTRVTLTANGQTREVGTYDGSCLVINGSSWALAENEVTGVICWFGGAGDEAGVFYENGQYVVKHGVIEEGADGESGKRGGYETLFAL